MLVNVYLGAKFVYILQINYLPNKISFETASVDREICSGSEFSKRVVAWMYKYYDEKWHETFYSFPLFLSMYGCNDIRSIIGILNC